MAASHPARTAESMSKLRTPVQKAALAVGAVFLVVGLLGFVPGITTGVLRQESVEDMCVGVREFHRRSWSG